jgi:hypothetical protein
MKKIITLILCLASFIGAANAKLYFIDPVSGNNANNGLTWSTAVKSIYGYTQLAGIADGDSIWAKGGTITESALTGGITTGFTYLRSLGNKNFFGGFKGDETSISQRPLVDMDGNGIVEPWEFQYPTTLYYISIDKTALKFGTGDFNGFTFTVKGTFNSRYASCFELGETTTFRNNIIKACKVTLAMNLSGSSNYAPLIKGGKSISNCLFEKDTVLVTATLNLGCSPFIYVGNNNVTSLSGTKFINNVIRNNKVTMDYSKAATGVLNDKSRGLLVQVGAVLNTTPQTNQQSTVANCVIHNNEITYIKNDAATMTNGSLIANNYGAATDSIINNTIVNNKGTLIKNAGLNILSGSTIVEYHFIMNNVFYNNQLDGVVNNINGTSTLGMIANNYFNGGGSTYTNGTYISNNDNTLGTGNLPNFKTPTTEIGNSTMADNIAGSASLSDWRISSGSYLIAKGIATTRLNDKAGIPFAATRAVGAYEYVADVPTGLKNTQNDFKCYSTNCSLELRNVHAGDEVVIYSLTGAKVVAKNLNTTNASFPLSKGIYLVRVANNVQKVVVQ